MVETGHGRGQKNGGASSLPRSRFGDGAGLQAGGPDPAGLGHVDGDAIRRGVLHLDVAGPVTILPDAERLVDVVARLGPGVLKPLRDRLEALDLEADVMDAAPARTALHSGDRVVLEVEDRQVEVAVAQVVAPGARAVDLRDLLHAEHVDVELRGLVHVLGREGDVLDLRHVVSPVEVVRARPGTCPGRLHGGLGKSQDNDSWSPAALGRQVPARHGAAGCKTYRNVHALTVARQGPPAMRGRPWQRLRRLRPRYVARFAGTTIAPGPGGYAERRVVARPPRRSYRL